MDRIKNLSLDQKAKLYYMALLQKGMIDTLPEDPKAAYVQSMMDEPASSKFSEPMGDKDDYGRSVSGKDKRTFMEPKDMTMAARAKKMAGMEETNDPEDDAEQAEYDKGWYGESSDYADRLANSGTDSDGRNTWGDKTGYSDEEMRQGKGKLKKYPDKDGRNVWGDKVDYSDEEKAKSLKEIASELGYIAEESNQYQKASFVYTEQGGHFYSLTLYSSDGQKQKMRYDEANEWLKGVLEYIHEGDLIPRRYNSGLEDLDLIVARLEELGIEASHGDYMDVS
jgi:hypothetical protein